MIVAAPDEDALLALANRAAAAGLRHILVREPDYSNEATAVVLEPGMIASRLCSCYPLALKEKKAVT